MILNLYDEQINVDRQEELGKILGWYEDREAEKRLFSIIGPPGIGKSWLVIRSGEKIQAGGSLVLAAFLGYDPAQNRRIDDLTTPAGRTDWLKETWEKLRDTFGSSLPPLDLSATFKNNIENLAGTICRPVPRDRPPLLILDGYEEVDAQLRTWLEANLLLPFYSAGCTRILLTRRDENALQTPVLKFNEQPLCLSRLKTTESAEQLVKLAPAGLPPTWVDDLKRSMPPAYPWNHAGANAWLAEQAESRYKAGSGIPPFTAQDVLACLMKLSQIPGGAARPVTLAALRQLAAEFTTYSSPPRCIFLEGELRQRGMLPDRPPLAELLAFGFVQDDGRAYFIPDGILELILAWNQL